MADDEIFDSICLSDILCLLTDEHETAIKNRTLQDGSISPCANATCKMGNNFLQQTSEDIITAHVKTQNEKMIARQMSGYNSKTKANIALGVPNQARQRRHEQLEDDYWKLKLDLLGLKCVHVRELSGDPTTLQTSETKIPSKSTTPEVKRFDHFQQFLNSLQFDQRIKSAPPEGRIDCVNVREREHSHRQIPDVRLAKNKGYP